MLQAIERATRQPIAEMQLPSVDAVNDQRITKFKQRIADALAADDLGPFRQLVEQYEQECNVPAVEVAAALAKLVQGDQPLLLKAQERFARPADSVRPPRDARFERVVREKPAFERAARDDRPRPAAPPRHASASTESWGGPGASPRPQSNEARAPEPAARTDTRPPRSHHAEERERRPRRDDAPHKPAAGFETYRIEVGTSHGVKPGNIVGAIANEAGLDSKHIGRVDIQEDHSLIDLPEGMPAEIFRHLKKVWVSGQQLRITRGGEAHEGGARPPRSKKPPSFDRGGSDRPKRRPPGKPAR
jgi:ATP-dependent RNA helicase DeaD